MVGRASIKVREDTFTLLMRHKRLVEARMRQSLTMDQFFKLQYEVIQPDDIINGMIKIFDEKRKFR